MSCLYLFICFTLSSGCMKWDYGEDLNEFHISESGLFILCEGNFQYSNSTLSFYEPNLNKVENEIFFRANGMKLGDVAQSMTIYDNKGWIAVNNSHVVFSIDLNTFKEIGRIENLTAPRYIHFVSDEKAYITQIWDNRIFIVNPKTYSVIGYISVPGMEASTGSTEQMVQIGDFVYCNCWSYQNKILKINTITDKVEEELIVGVQPNSLVADKYNRIWTITDGGYDGSPYGYESPGLYCISTDVFKIEKYFEFNIGDSPSEIIINGEGDTIYWINNDIWSMGVEDLSLPSSPVIPFKDTRYYGLTVNPVNNDLYVADAIDFSQQGMILRFSQQGNLIDKFYVGISPGAFCWKLK